MYNGRLRAHRKQGEDNDESKETHCAEKNGATQCRVEQSGEESSGIVWSEESRLKILAAIEELCAPPMETYEELCAPPMDSEFAPTPEDQSNGATECGVDSSGEESSRVEQSGEEESSGVEQSGKESSGVEWSGEEWSGEESSGVEWWSEATRLKILRAMAELCPPMDTIDELCPPPMDSEFAPTPEDQSDESKG